MFIKVPSLEVIETEPPTLLVTLKGSRSLKLQQFASLFSY
ncbi:hypothetical protein Mcup_1315 [Metallosphaera cuprina Ar-4]|uniref:Uncharacterized protein n=1 Tax=Metallosphaera cuprina (strain Ar-4) TaxID=1006006 RepID=F4FY45_METCR|nr:hypothetical protein Mcup_1315 [Metallosphaera cuprina Ar-4]